MTEPLERIHRLVAEWKPRVEGFPDPIVIAAGALERVAPYVRERGWRRVLLVADANTMHAAGERVRDDLAAAGTAVATALIRPNALGDVVADEASVAEARQSIRAAAAEAVIVTGAGTLHDIARYAAFCEGVPFVSVPTAPSVDGFTSKGAPLIIRGEKTTVQAIGPDAIFADLDVLRQAPPELVAAGFGDMIGKTTSLFDWKFGRRIAGEPYDAEVAAITERALGQCIAHAEAIGRRTEEGIRTLICALVESGLAMLIFGQSHPASGAEHHLSHYWEMAFIREGRRQLLHGAKVGVACAEVLDLYRTLADRMRNGPDPHWRETVADLDRLPAAGDIRRLLKTAGGPADIGELGIERDLLERGLREAHRIRPNRHTLLRAWNEGALP
jgi:glycerol-1-phosphate dehydrogenase [NAD(P)+]